MTLSKEQAESLAKEFRETAEAFNRSADQMEEMADALVREYNLESSATPLKKPSNIVVPMSKRIC